MARRVHGQDDWLCYHITTRTIDKEFLLANDREKEKILSTLEFYRNKGRYRLFAFVLMDNHLHMVIEPAIGEQFSEILRDIKTFTSRNCLSKPPNCPLWEERYDDNRIESSQELWSVVNYIHNNPVKAGLARQPDDYPWSSVHNYSESGLAKIEIDCDWWKN